MKPRRLLPLALGLIVFGAVLAFAGVALNHFDPSAYANVGDHWYTLLHFN
ncbi:hypothetical protein [Lacticaseibacillus daqingensis]|nr:hypothetical protein [Lacticaseibacillus daqingensis]